MYAYISNISGTRQGRRYLDGAIKQEENGPNILQLLKTGSGFIGMRSNPMCRIKLHFNSVNKWLYLRVLKFINLF